MAVVSVAPVAELAAAKRFFGKVPFRARIEEMNFTRSGYGGKARGKAIVTSICMGELIAQAYRSGKELLATITYDALWKGSTRPRRAIQAFGNRDPKIVLVAIGFRCSSGQIQSI